MHQRHIKEVTLHRSQIAVHAAADAFDAQFLRLLILRKGFSRVTEYMPGKLVKQDNERETATGC